MTISRISLNWWADVLTRPEYSTEFRLKQFLSKEAMEVWSPIYFEAAAEICDLATEVLDEQE